MLDITYAYNCIHEQYGGNTLSDSQQKWQIVGLQGLQWRTGRPVNVDSTMLTCIAKHLLLNFAWLLCVEELAWGVAANAARIGAFTLTLCIIWCDKGSLASVPAPHKYKVRSAFCAFCQDGLQYHMVQPSV